MVTPRSAPSDWTRSGTTRPRASTASTPAGGGGAELAGWRVSGVGPGAGEMSGAQALGEVKGSGSRPPWRRWRLSPAGPGWGAFLGARGGGGGRRSEDLVFPGREVLIEEEKII